MRSQAKDSAAAQTVRDVDLRKGWRQPGSGTKKPTLLYTFMHSLSAENTIKLYKLCLLLVEFEESGQCSS